MASEALTFSGVLKGHGGWVTSIAAPLDASKQMLISGSRDKTVMQWNLERRAGRPSELYGEPQKALVGHNDFVQDVQLSKDGMFALSGAWDNTLKLWDLQGGKVTNFKGHTNDVTTVAFSECNRQIVSGSRDRTIRLWNTLGTCKFTISPSKDKTAHDDWVSCCRFSPNPTPPLVVSGGWDGKVKIWNLADFSLKSELKPPADAAHPATAHRGHVSSVSIAPDGSLCATGGRDGQAALWDLHKEERLYELGDSGDAIHALAFSPKRFWLCAATEKKIRVWDLENRNVVAELFPETEVVGKVKNPEPISLAWSSDGQTLFAGYTDSLIRVWTVNSSIN